MNWQPLGSLDDGMLQEMEYAMPDVDASLFSSNGELFQEYSSEVWPIFADDFTSLPWSSPTPVSTENHYNDGLWSDQEPLDQPRVIFNTSSDSQIQIMSSNIAPADQDHNTRRQADWNSNRVFQNEHGSFDKRPRLENFDPCEQHVWTDCDLPLSQVNPVIRLCGNEAYSSVSTDLLSTTSNSRLVSADDSATERNVSVGNLTDGLIPHPRHGSPVYDLASEHAQEVDFRNLVAAKDSIYLQQVNISDSPFREQMFETNESNACADTAWQHLPGNGEYDQLDSCISAEHVPVVVPMKRPMHKNQDQRPSLRLVHDNGCHKSFSWEIESRPVRARRCGPLSKEKAQRAAKTRHRRSKCILCHFRKVPVSYCLWPHF